MSSDAVRAKNIYGNLPLHTYLKNVVGGFDDVNPTVIRVLVSCFQESLLVYDSEGSTPLHRVCNERTGIRGVTRLHGIEYMVQACPSCVTQFHGPGRLPLHLLCEHMGVVSHLRSVQFLANTCPASLYAIDDYGFTPLHCVSKAGIQNDADMQVVWFLVDACPECVELCDIEGQSPLHLLCKSAKRVTVPLIKFIVDSFPEVLRVTDHFGNTPLHIACDSFTDNEVVSFLAQKCPVILLLPGGQRSETPLLLACRFYGYSRCGSIDCDFYGCQKCCGLLQDLIRSLAVSEEVVKAASASNHLYNDTPVHLLSSKGAPGSILQILLEKCPEAARLKNNFGQTPLHKTIEGYDRSDRPERERIISYEETVKCLLKAFPTAMETMDNMGVTPLVLACKMNVSLSLIYLLFSVDPISNMTLLGATPLSTAHNILELLGHFFPVRQRGRKRKRPLSAAEA